MHELSLCRGIYGIVDRGRSGRRVETVELRVGQLRQVVPQTLEYCWGLVTEGTPLAGSALAIDHVPVLLRCNGCGERTQVEHTLVLVCSACRGADVEVEQGEEMLVTSLRLAAEPAPPPSHVLTEET